MHDPWIEKVSDSLDGLLSPAEQRALDEHLANCSDCRVVAEEIREVVAAAHKAPPVEPGRDLWPGIAAGIAASTDAAPPRDDARLTALSPIPIRSVRRSTGRRFSFSAPQLAAAAVLLMLASGTSVWLIGGQEPAQVAASGTIIQTAGISPRNAQLVSTAPAATTGYDDDIADLEAALDADRSNLDPATVEIVERSLESIDDAIEDARAALAADPGNPHLHRQLDNTMRKKIDVLRRATGAQRGQS